MTGRRELVGLLLFGLFISAVVATGIGVRATYGAQTSADEPQYLLSALSLWEDGNLDISDELAEQRYREFHEAELPEQTSVRDDGRRVSPHDPLLPLLLAVPMGLGGWVAAKAGMAVLAGALAALTVCTARTRLSVSKRTAYLMVGLFALAPPLAVYSTQVYPEIVAALALLAGFGVILGPFGLRGQLIFVVAVIALPWLAVKYVPVAAALAVAGLIRARERDRLWLLGVFVIAGVGYLVGHMLIYDGLTAYAAGDHFVGGEFTAVGTDVNLWGRSTRLIGLLVDRAFGIGAWQPAFLLLPLVGGWALARRRPPLGLALSLIGVGWIVATFVALTMHGWWFPGRQLVVVLPVVVLVLAVWVDQTERARLLVALGLPGVAAFGFLVAEGLRRELTWIVDFASTANPLYRVFATLLPDYMEPTAGTWALHGVWVVAAVALALLGWREGSRQSEELADELGQASTYEKASRSAPL